MCGYVGSYSFSGKTPSMEFGIPVIRNRGQDEFHRCQGDHYDIAHASLSITDPSFKQPVVSERGDFLLFNGEIYNHQELRKNLETQGHRFSSPGDTEVLFKYLQLEGMNCLFRLNGMFSFVWFDSRQNHLYLVRDRLGIKPLYYREKGAALCFSTNLKSLLDPSDSFELDQEVLDSISLFRYNPHGRSVFKGIHSLEPGHIFLYSEKGSSKKCYWDPKEIASHRHAHSDTEELHELLTDAISLRTPCEPYAVYLSGGLDSSFLSLGAHAVRNDQSAFSWKNEINEEASLAQTLCEKVGIPFHAIQSDLLSLDYMGEVQRATEEPLLDSITLVNYWLGKEVSKTHRIVLSGEGADEVFGGYIHHKLFAYAQLISRYFPFVPLSSLASIIKALPIALFQSVFPYPGGISQEGIIKLMQFFQQWDSPYKAFLSLSSLRSFEESRLPLMQELENSWPDFGEQEIYRELCVFDFKKWSGSYVLPRLDKLNSCHNLEARVPFFDHRLVEWSLRAPMHEKVDLLQDKKILRHLFAKRFPAFNAISQRKKYPFYLENRSETGFLREQYKNLSSQLDPRFQFEEGEVFGLLEKKRYYAALLYSSWLKEFDRFL